MMKLNEIDQTVTQMEQTKHRKQPLDTRHNSTHVTFPHMAVAVAAQGWHRSVEEVPGLGCAHETRTAECQGTAQRQLETT